jgi:Domain of unknown function (DUF4150)
MFATTQFLSINIAFPDVCKTPTPAGTVPLPLPNLAPATTHIPVVFNIFIGGGMVHNQLTLAPTSTGDEPGVGGGVLDSMIKGMSCYLLGSFKVIYGVAPAARMASPTIQNCAGVIPNALGAALIPSQVKVLLLG